MQTRSVELLRHHNIQGRNSNCDNYLFEVAFNYDFWIRVKVHQEGNSQISKQINLDHYQHLPRSLSDALNLYETLSSPT